MGLSIQYLMGDRTRFYNLGLFIFVSKRCGIFNSCASLFNGAVLLLHHDLCYCTAATKH